MIFSCVGHRAPLCPQWPLDALQPGDHRSCRSRPRTQVRPGSAPQTGAGLMKLLMELQFDNKHERKVPPTKTEPFQLLVLTCGELQWMDRLELRSHSGFSPDPGSAAPLGVFTDPVSMRRWAALCRNRSESSVHKQKPCLSSAEICKHNSETQVRTECKQKVFYVNIIESVGFSKQTPWMEVSVVDRMSRFVCLGKQTLQLFL